MFSNLAASEIELYIIKHLPSFEYLYVSFLESPWEYSSRLIEFFLDQKYPYNFSLNYNAVSKANTEPLKNSIASSPVFHFFISVPSSSN
jgi:hypothetical protein